MLTTTARKISFTILGLLIVAFFILIHFTGHPSTNLFPYATAYYISGFIFLILGYRKWPILWYVFFILFSFYFIELGAIFAHTGQYPSLLTIITVFGFITLAVLVITSLFRVYQKPFAVKNEVILALVFLALLPTFATFLGFLHGKATQYNYNMKTINFILPEKFSSFEECKSRHVFEEAGFCYGYFASQNNNINLCNEYIDKNVDPLLDKNYINMNCITGFSVYKNDPSICNSLNEGFQAKCQFHYFIAKKEFDKCKTIKYKPSDYFSYTSDKCLEYNPGWYVKEYARLVDIPD